MCAATGLMSAGLQWFVVRDGSGPTVGHPATMRQGRGVRGAATSVRHRGGDG